MKPKTRTFLSALEDRLSECHDGVSWIENRLRTHQHALDSELSDAADIAATCLSNMDLLYDQVSAIFDSDEKLSLRSSGDTLADSEIAQLVALNRRLSGISNHIRQVKDEVTPLLQAKVADPNDLMMDYEIDAVIDYVLREDDPDYAPDDDNILTTRHLSLSVDLPSDAMDWSESIMQTDLRAKPHCWLFHDLYDHDYGRESPRVPFRDCLRIGHIFVDVIVRQQYEFQVNGDGACAA